MTAFTDETTIREARERLRMLAYTNGHQCPVCTQYAKVYRRPLTAVSAAALIALHRHAGRDWGHMPTVAQQRLPKFAHQGGYLTLGSYWGLIEEAKEPREDGGRAGWWRLTAEGSGFVRGLVAVPKYARIYDGRALSYEGPDVTVEQVLGERFDYRELMYG